MPVCDNQAMLYINILGQLCVLQSWMSPVKPTQSAPPYCGTGFVHVLDLFCDPPPQVTEHIAQFVQSSQPPSTRSKQTIVEKGRRKKINNASSNLDLTLTLDLRRRTKYKNTEKENRMEQILGKLVTEFNPLHI